MVSTSFCFLIDFDQKDLILSFSLTIKPLCYALDICRQSHNNWKSPIFYIWQWPHWTQHILGGHTLECSKNSYRQHLYQWTLNNLEKNPCSRYFLNCLPHYTITFHSDAAFFYPIILTFFTQRWETFCTQW